MKALKSMYYQFIREPLWFKVLISLTLLASILFSSSMFSDHVYFNIIAKLAAAIFFAHTESKCAGTVKFLLFSLR